MLRNRISQSIREQPIQWIQEFHFGFLANSLVMRMFLKYLFWNVFICILLEVSRAPFFTLLYNYKMNYKITQINLCFLFTSTLTKTSYFFNVYLSVYYFEIFKYLEMSFYGIFSNTVNLWCSHLAALARTLSNRVVLTCALLLLYVLGFSEKCLHGIVWCFVACVCVFSLNSILIYPFFFNLCEEAKYD